MSGELTARDVIAQALSDWYEVGDPPNQDDISIAGAVLLALDAAGLEVTEKTSQWEWGIRWDDGEVTVGEPNLQHARQVVSSAYDAEAVVRRRPAGAWEVTE